MPVNLTRNTILLQSFENAALSIPQKRDAMKIPAASNGSDSMSSGDSIFRTTDK
jgi:hypothetical protein